MQRWKQYLLPPGMAVALWLAAPAARASKPPETLQVTADMTTRNVRVEESSLANLVADALRAVEKSDIAFIPASAFTETTLSRGSVSASDVLKALEHADDTVTIVNLKGSQVRRALAHGLTLYPQKNSAFLHVSGLSVTVDPSRERDGRIVAVKVGKSPLEDNKTYTVAMPSPLANGALAYFKVWGKSDVDHDTNRTLADAVTDFLRGQKTIGAKGEDRLVFKK